MDSHKKPLNISEAILQFKTPEGKVTCQIYYNLNSKAPLILVDCYFPNEESINDEEKIQEIDDFLYEKILDFVQQNPHPYTHKQLDYKVEYLYSPIVDYQKTKIYHVRDK